MLSSAKVFDIQIPVTPNQGVSGQQFLITREFAKATSDDTSIRLNVEQTPSDVQNTYRTDDLCIVASPGIPGHKIGPFASDDLDPGNQRYLKRIPRTTKTKSTKQATPVGQIGIGTNGVPFFSYKSEDTKLFGGVKSISVVDAGDGYDITNPPIVEFEPLWRPDTNYFLGQRVRNSSGQRYKNLGSGKSAQRGTEPTHSSGNAVQDGQCLWDFEGSQQRQLLVFLVEYSQLTLLTAVKTTQPLLLLLFRVVVLLFKLLRQQRSLLVELRQLQSLLKVVDTIVFLQ